MSETQPTWKHRCYRMAAALGIECGEPDWLMPDDRNKLKEAQNALTLATTAMDLAREVIKSKSVEVVSGVCVTAVNPFALNDLSAALDAYEKAANSLNPDSPGTDRPS